MSRRPAPAQGSRERGAAVGRLGTIAFAAVAALFLGLTGASAVSAAGASASAASDASSAANEPLTVGVTGEVDTLNPMTFVMAVSYTLQSYLWDGLTAASKDSITGIAPSLAESWDVAPDGLTVTYHLRDGLAWSDGLPLTAADVEYTLDRVLAGGPSGGNWGSFLANVTAVTALDQTTVRLELDSPNATMPKLPIPILPKHVFEKYPDENLDAYPVDPAHIVTSGAYRLVEGSSGSAIYRFEAWPGNWRGESPVRFVNWRLFQAQDTVTQALLKGEIDFTLSINSLQLRLLESQPNVVANEYPELGVFAEVGFNSGSIDIETGEPLGDPNPAVLDPRFRYALSTAFDRTQVAHKAFKDSFVPLKTIIANGFEEFRWEVPADEPSDYDPELAARRLDEAGYPLGPDGKRMLPSGQPVGTLRIAVDPSSPSDLIGAKLVSEWMEDLGFDMRLTAMSNGKLDEAVMSGNYDMFWWGWAYDADPDQVLVYLTCDQRGVFSDSWYCSDEFDALYAQQKNELDPDRRAAIIKDMQRVLYQDAPYIVMGANTGKQAYRTDRWQGWSSWLQKGGNVMWDVAALYDLHPAPASAGGDADRPSQVAVILYGSIAGITIIVLLGRILVVRWRRSTAEERE